MSFSASLSPCPSIIHSSDSVDGSPGDPQVNVAMDAQNKAALSIHPIHSPMHPSLVLLSQEPDPKEEEEEGEEEEEEEDKEEEEEDKEGKEEQEESWYLLLRGWQSHWEDRVVVTPVL